MVRLTECTRLQMERLLGKLQFVSNCVQPGRVLVLRLREVHRSLPLKGHCIIPKEAKSDIHWWLKYLPSYDRVSIMWMIQHPVADSFLATDACLTGMGAICGKYFAHSIFPQEWTRLDQGITIAHLELLALIVAIKSWKHKVTGNRFCVHCDNLLVVQAVNAGMTKNKLMADLPRELCFVAAVNKCEVVVLHVLGINNRIPDILSRIHTHQKFNNQFCQIRQPDWINVDISPALFNIAHDWVTFSGIEDRRNALDKKLENPCRRCFEFSVSVSSLPYRVALRTSRTLSDSLRRKTNMVQLTTFIAFASDTHFSRVGLFFISAYLRQMYVI